MHHGLDRIMIIWLCILCILCAVNAHFTVNIDLETGQLTSDLVNTAITDFSLENSFEYSDHDQSMIIGWKEIPNSIFMDELNITLVYNHCYLTLKNISLIIHAQSSDTEWISSQMLEQSNVSYDSTGDSPCFSYSNENHGKLTVCKKEEKHISSRNACCTQNSATLLSISTACTCTGNFIATSDQGVFISATITASEGIYITGLGGTVNIADAAILTAPTIIIRGDTVSGDGFSYRGSASYSNRLEVYGSSQNGFGGKILNSFQGSPGSSAYFEFESESSRGVTMNLNGRSVTFYNTEIYTTSHTTDEPLNIHANITFVGPTTIIGTGVNSGVALHSNTRLTIIDSDPFIMTGVGCNAVRFSEQVSIVNSSVFIDGTSSCAAPRGIFSHPGKSLNINMVESSLVLEASVTSNSGEGNGVLLQRAVIAQDSFSDVEIQSDVTCNSCSKVTSVSLESTTIGSCTITATGNGAANSAASTVNGISLISSNINNANFLVTLDEHDLGNVWGVRSDADSELAEIIMDIEIQGQSDMVGVELEGIIQEATIDAVLLNSQSSVGIVLGNCELGGEVSLTGIGGTGISVEGDINSPGSLTLLGTGSGGIGVYLSGNNISVNSLSIDTFDNILMSDNTITADSQVFSAFSTEISGSVEWNGVTIDIESDIYDIEGGLLIIDASSEFHSGFVNTVSTVLESGTHVVDGSIYDLHLVETSIVLEGTGHVELLQIEATNTEIHPGSVSSTAAAMSISNMIMESNISIEMDLNSPSEYSRLIIEDITSNGNAIFLLIHQNIPSVAPNQNFFLINNLPQNFANVQVKDNQSNSLVEGSRYNIGTKQYAVSYLTSAPSSPVQGWLSLRRIPSPSATPTSSKSFSTTISLSKSISASHTISLTPSESGPRTPSITSTATPSPSQSPSTSNSRTVSHTSTKTFLVFASPILPSLTVNVNTVPSIKKSLGATMIPSASKSKLAASKSKFIQGTLQVQVTQGAVVPQTAPSGVGILIGTVDQQVIASSDTSGVVSTVINLQLQQGQNQGQELLGGTVEVCLEPNAEQRKVDSLCLGFLDESQFPPVWICQDNCLSVKDNLYCGNTDHFTNFALLLNGNNNNKDCESDNSLDAFAWISLAFICMGIIFVLLGVVGIEIYYQRKRIHVERVLSYLNTIDAPSLSQNEDDEYII